MYWLQKFIETNFLSFFILSSLLLKRQRILKEEKARKWRSRSSSWRGSAQARICHDFISKTVADALIARGAKVVPTTGRVCSAFKAEGRSLSSSVILKYGFWNILTRTTDSITIQPVSMKDLNAPLIIGLQTIGEHNLLRKQIPKLCGQSQEEKRILALKSPSEPLTRKAAELGSTWPSRAAPSVTVDETTRIEAPGATNEYACQLSRRESQRGA